MTPIEELIYKLGKDVAVMYETQKSFQRAQTKTTENIDKLAVSVDTLAQETIRLEGVFTNIGNVEKRLEDCEKTIFKRLDRIENTYSVWSKAVIGGLFVAAVGAVFKYVGGP